MAVVFDKLLNKLLSHSHIVELDTRYLVKAGLVGGQTAIGGLGVTDILSLQGTSGNGTLTSPAIQALVGNNGATTALTILNNGNVGIGTTGPGAKLEVYQSSQGNTTIPFQVKNPSILNDNTAVGIGFNTGVIAKGAIIYNRNSYSWGIGDIVFAINGIGDNTTAASLSDAKMVIKKTGNVGIGVTDPDTKLEVFGSTGLKISFDATDNAIFAVDTNGDLTISPSGTKMVLAGGLTTSGAVIATPDEITATGEGVAASVATVNTEVTTNGDSDLDNVTLANGTSGQIKHIYCVVEGNAADTWKITPATMCGGTQITFAGVGEGCTLIYADNEGWVATANNGGTIS